MSGREQPLVPEGYQQTEIGFLPRSWSVCELQDIAQVKGGKRLPKGKKLLNTSTNHPYIRVADMFMGGVDLSDIRYVPDDVASAIKNYRISATDLFISVAGTLGVVGRVPKALDGANLTENADKITSIELNQDYLLFCLMSERIQDDIASNSTVGAQPKLALGRIASFLIPIPETDREQAAIANALSDVDALITSLEELIAKKRAMKTAAMQQLLTGKKRLPPFDQNPTGTKQTELGEIPEDWEVVPFFEKVGIAQGQVDPRHEPYKSMLLIGPKHVEAGTGKLTFTETAEAQGAISGKYHFQSGDVLYGKINPYLMKATLVDFEGLCSADMYPLRPASGLSSGFLLAVILGEKFTRYAISVSARSGMPKINRKELSEFQFVAPSDKQEQIAIAELLFDLDGELEKLEQRFAKTQQLKQGMMQELLTGRTRLV